MKTARVLITIAFMAFLVSQSYSQIGIKLGVHSFDISSPRDIIVNDNTTISYDKANLGFQGGIYGRINLGGMFIEPGLMFNSTEVSYTLDGENGSLVNNVKNESFTNLDIPLLVGCKLLFMDLFVGPVAHIHIDSTSDLFDISEYDQKFNNAEYGFRAGLGVEVGNVNLSLEYEGNFSNFGDHITIAGQEFDFGDKPSRLLLNLGLNIF